MGTLLTLKIKKKKRFCYIYWEGYNKDGFYSILSKLDSILGPKANEVLQEIEI